MSVISGALLTLSSGSKISRGVALTPKPIDLFRHVKQRRIQGLCCPWMILVLAILLLNYLKKFPIDALKIDASFVRDVQTDPNDRAIIKSIIALARNMGLKIIAESVESPAQLEILATMGCDYIQSYFVGHPMSASDCEQQFLIKSKR